MLRLQDIYYIAFKKHLVQRCTVYYFKKDHQKNLGNLTDFSKLGAYKMFHVLGIRRLQLEFMASPRHLPQAELPGFANRDPQK